MFSKFAASSITARARPLAPTSRHRASTCAASWFSSCVRRKRTTDRSQHGWHIRTSQSTPSFLVPNQRTDQMTGSTGNAHSMGSTVNARMKPRGESSSVLTDIEDIHRDAIIRKESTYIDPQTGFMVFTELAHLKRGRCCGNQCRHCPYGWSNVNRATGGFTAAEGNATAVSGDREGTGRLVKHILDGTYYQEDVCSRGEVIPCESRDMTSPEPCEVAKIDDACDNPTSETCQPASQGEGKGGSAGGTLTSKNVPYTRKGDAGTSQLFTGERRSKDDVLFEALGTVDELCSIAGVVYAELNTARERRQSGVSEMNTTYDVVDPNTAIYGDLPDQLLDVMSRLFDIGSHIAKPPRTSKEGYVKREKGNEFQLHHSKLLERWIDTMTEQLPELTSFILPTGSPASAQLHVARTVCRRAERRMVPLVREEGTVDPAALAYVNRLSDFFFTAARFVNFCDDRDEVQYRREGENGANRAAEQNRGKIQRERVVVKLKK